LASPLSVSAMASNSAGAAWSSSIIF
jgi:hypothetical protein